MASMLHRACLVLLMAAPLLASGRAPSDAVASAVCEQAGNYLEPSRQVCSQNIALTLLQRKSVRLGNTSGSGSPTRDAGSRPKVVFIKTHYTGSSCMTGIFQRYCDQHHVNCAPRAPGETTTREKLSEYVRSHSNDTVDIWPWHVVYDKASFEKLIPGAVTVSILRDPIPRMKSFLAHNYMSTHHVNKVLHSLQKNDGKVPNCNGRKHTTMFEVLPRLSELDLVMLTEDYYRSVVLLARKLKWPLQDLLFIRLRESKPDQHKQELLDEVEAYLSRPLENMTENGKAFMKKCILKDQEIYNEAKEIFQKQLNALSHAEVEKDVARLQSANQALEECCMEAHNDLYCALMHELPPHWHRRTESGQSLPPGVFDDRCRQRALSALG